MKDYHAPLIPGHYYHIFNRGNNRENIFSNPGNYVFFLQKLGRYILPYLKIYAYCLLPNHFHLLVQVRDEETVINTLTKLPKFSKGMSEHKPLDLDINSLLEERFQRFFASYALAYNRQQNRTGSLFQKRFKRIRIHENSDFIKVMHYIHNNPIHHGFCRSYDDWRYSSYKTMLTERQTRVERSAVLEWFGSAEDFLEFHAQMIDYGEIEDFLIE